MTAKRPTRLVAAPPTRRINHGKGHSYLVDNRKPDGVTGLIAKAVPKNLSAWSAKAGCRWMLDNRELIGKTSDDALIELAGKAPFAARDAAAARGTEVHALAERYASGETVDVPDHMLGYVETYADWLESWRPADMLAEQMIVNRRYNYAGTFDLVATLPGLGRTLVDYKTGASGAFGETALQLAAYGFAETRLDPGGGIEEPMVRPDAYCVLHLQHDQWTMYRYDVGEREFRTFLYVAELARWLTARCDWKDPSDPVRSGALPRPEPVETHA